MTRTLLSNLPFWGQECHDLMELQIEWGETKGESRGASRAFLGGSSGLRREITTCHSQGGCVAGCPSCHRRLGRLMADSGQTSLHCYSPLMLQSGLQSRFWWQQHRITPEGWIRTEVQGYSGQLWYLPPHGLPLQHSPDCKQASSALLALVKSTEASGEFGWNGVRRSWTGTGVTANTHFCRAWCC